MRGFHRYGLRSCRVPGCYRDDICGWGYCAMHYARWHRHGTTDERQPAVCTVPGCGWRAKARGYCHMHYYRVKRHGHTDPKRPTQCQVVGCERRDMLGHGYCTMHYMRWKRHGDTDKRKPGGQRKGARALNEVQGASSSLRENVERDKQRIRE